MIKVQQLTPAVYYNESRDFQVLGRICDVVLNDVKTNIDLMYNLPLNRNTDTALVDLVISTLGFRSLHEYNINQLSSMASAFTEILKYKGSIKSIELATRVLLKVVGSSDDCAVVVDNAAGVISIYISQDVTDVVLLLDLLPYILPVGMICKIIRHSFVEVQSTTTTNMIDSTVFTEGIVSAKSHIDSYVESGEYIPSDFSIGVIDNASVVPYESGE